MKLCFECDADLTALYPLSPFVNELNACRRTRHEVREVQMICRNCKKQKKNSRAYGDGNFCSQKCAAEWADWAIRTAPKYAQNLRAAKNRPLVH